jgi:hypothetical protein
VISSREESLLIMEKATCSLSAWMKTFARNQRLDSYASIYKSIVEAAYLLDETGVSHCDMHPGNIGLLLKDAKGIICNDATQAHSVNLSDPNALSIKFIDFGMSCWTATTAEAGNLVRQGYPAFMAPEHFLPSDGWAVLLIGYQMAGVNLPWLELNRRGAGPHAIDLMKKKCLLGDTFSYSDKCLAALLDSSFVTSWRETSLAELKKIKWPFSRFMSELFSALLANELDVLRQGSTNQKWSERVRHVPIRDN